MALTQDADSKKGIAEINPASEQGHCYTAIGSIWLVVAQGTLAGTEIKDAPKGSLVVLTDSGKIYVKSSVAGATSTFIDLTVQ